VRAGFDTLVEMLFRLDAPADIPGDAQQARLTLKSKCRPAPLGVKSRTVPAYVQHACVKQAAGTKRLQRFTEILLAVGGKGPASRSAW
jgi:hypothetical protein